MSKLDSQNRIQIPRPIYNASNLKAADIAKPKLYYLFNTNEIYLSKLPEKDFSFGYVTIDDKFRVCITSNIRKALQITEDTNYIICEKQGRVYLKQMP